MNKQQEPQKQVTTPSKPATLHTSAKLGIVTGVEKRPTVTKND